MKTLLLKNQNILFLAFIAFFSAQAQGTSDTEADDIQMMRIEFNTVDGPEASRELQLSFSENTSDDYESGLDIKNLDVSHDDLNLGLNGEELTDQAYGPITEDKSVPLLLRSSGSYTFTIKLTVTENMEGQDLYLKDNLTGAYFDLKQGLAYEFTSLEGNFPNRFDILFKTQSTTLSQINHKIEGLDVRYAMNSNTLVVLNSKNKKITSIELYNIFGQTAYVNTNLEEGNSNRIQLRNLSTGAYIVRLVTADNGILTKKIIVK